MRKLMMTLALAALMVTSTTTFAEDDKGDGPRRKFGGEGGRPLPPSFDTAAIFKKLDTNNDGVISEAEFAKLPEVMRSMIGTPGGFPGAGGPGGLGGRFGGKIDPEKMKELRDKFKGKIDPEKMKELRDKFGGKFDPEKLKQLKDRRGKGEEKPEPIAPRVDR